MIEIFQYTNQSQSAWDELCLKSPNGTFLHTRRYLEHQRERFHDCSLIIFKNGKMVAVLPAAASLEDSESVVSHPGLTYGGLVTDGTFGASTISLIMPLLLSKFRGFGYKQFVYKPLPRIYQVRPSEDDEFVLSQMGATLSRAQLNCVIDLNSPTNLSSRKKRNLKKAHSLELVEGDSTLLPDYFRILSTNLRQRHGVAPVHTLIEMQFLQNAFSKEFGLYFAKLENDLVGGVIVFRTEKCWHAQYISMSDQGAELGVVDFTLSSAIENARRSGANYFSLGVSNDPDTGELNDSLYRFKREFGGGGSLQNTWSVIL